MRLWRISGLARWDSPARIGDSTIERRRGLFGSVSFCESVHTQSNVLYFGISIELGSFEPGCGWPASGQLVVDRVRYTILQGPSTVETVPQT